MTADFSSLLVLALSVSVTFFVARWLRARWLAHRKQQSDPQARAGESRQVRRARERQAKGE